MTQWTIRNSIVSAHNLVWLRSAEVRDATGQVDNNCEMGEVRCVWESRSEEYATYLTGREQ